MAGQSAQEKASQEQYDSLKGFTGDIGSGKFDVKNRFDTYTDPFSYEDINTKLDDIFGGYESKIKRDTNDAIATQQGNAAARMASRGVVGGSAVDDVMTDIGSSINKTKVNALSELGTNKALSLTDLMKTINSMDLYKTNAATNVDLTNKRNALGGLSNAYGLQQNAIAGLDDTTAWDNILAVLKTGAQSAGGIAELIKAL
jgi:hypothetical protein